MTCAQNLCIAVSLVLACSATSALAQSQTGQPSSDTAEASSAKDLAQMTPEELEASLEDMIVNLGVSLGLDEAELRAASPDERELMLEQAAQKMQRDMERRLEEQFGLPYAELEKMSEEEINALMAEQPRGAQVEEPPLPLFPALASGFPDGSVGIPVGNDMIASIEVSGSSDRPMILVVVDGRKKRLLSRRDITLPFQDTIALNDLDGEPAHFVIELIDPATGRVEQRFRPVSAPKNASSR